MGDNSRIWRLIHVVANGERGDNKRHKDLTEGGSQTVNILSDSLIPEKHQQ